MESKTIKTRVIGCILQRGQYDYPQLYKSGRSDQRDKREKWVVRHPLPKIPQFKESKAGKGKYYTASNTKPSH